jgi:molecular chaperone IbpA
VLRSYFRRCLALSLPGSILGVVFFWMGDPSQYIRYEGSLVQRIAIAIFVFLPLVTMLIFRFIFIAPYQLYYDLTKNGARNKFPQSNIVRTRENSYCILVAVAGFSRDEITITEHEQVLFIAGQKAQSEVQSGSSEHSCRGTFGYPFERRFNLAANVEVRGASLESGLLRIDVDEQLEPKRPRRIDIRAVRLTAQGPPTKIVDRPKVA